MSVSFLKPNERHYDSGDGRFEEEMAYGRAWQVWRTQVDAQPDRIRRMLDSEKGVVRIIGAVAANLFGTEVPLTESEPEF